MIDSASDAAMDGITTGSDSAVQPFCSSDPHLRLCFSFDQTTLPASLPNEGAATISASLTSVTRTTGADGGAALLGAASQIHLPQSSEVANILALEIWFRIDTPPADGQRSGLVDSNTNPNISLFINRADPVRTLRCGNGTDVQVWNAVIPDATWMYAACVCESGNLNMYLNGVLIGTHPGSTCAPGGGFVADGFVIGADNINNPTMVGDRLLGAIDGVRLWDVPLSAVTVCQHAGLSGC
jgi:hypothetical protein